MMTQDQLKNQIKETVKRNGEPVFKGTVLLMLAAIFFLILFKDTNKSFDEALTVTRKIANALYNNNNNNNITTWWKIK